MPSAAPFDFQIVPWTRQVSLLEFVRAFSDLSEDSWRPDVWGGEVD